MECRQVHALGRPLHIRLSPARTLVRLIRLPHPTVPRHYHVITRTHDKLVATQWVHEPGAQVATLLERLLFRVRIGLVHVCEAFHIGESAHQETMLLVKSVAVHGTNRLRCFVIAGQLQYDVALRFTIFLVRHMHRTQFNVQVCMCAKTLLDHFKQTLLLGSRHNGHTIDHHHVVERLVHLDVISSLNIRIVNICFIKGRLHRTLQSRRGRFSHRSDHTTSESLFPLAHVCNASRAIFFSSS